MSLIHVQRLRESPRIGDNVDEFRKDLGCNRDAVASGNQIIQDPTGVGMVSVFRNFGGN